MSLRQTLVDARNAALAVLHPDDAEPIIVAIDKISEEHDRRIAELLEANNREVERRRASEFRGDVLNEERREAQDWYREHEKTIRAAGIDRAPDFMVPF